MFGQWPQKDTAIVINVRLGGFKNLKPSLELAANNDRGEAKR
jgi:hypothetical protein